MDDDKYDELLSNGQRTITLKIPVSDHVWRAFKRACEYTQNNGRPFPKVDGGKIDAYGVHLEYAMESYIADLAKSGELVTFFMAEALQQVWAEKDAEEKTKQDAHSAQESKPTPDKNMG